MTNDPSMTITSTIPAPEGSDSTSREGKTIPLLVTEGGNAPPVQDAPPPALVQKIGNTTYEAPTEPAVPMPTRFWRTA